MAESKEKSDENLEAIDVLKVSAVDALVDDIRGLIDERSLQIGDSLPTERELSQMFSAGRNTVREAMQVLRAYGVIETKPKVGAIVSGGHGEALRKLFLFHHQITPESFQDVQIFRRTVEVGIGDTIILNATNEQLDHLHYVNEKILTCETGANAAKCDYRFHESLVELSGNRTTLATYRMLHPILEEIMHVGKEVRPNFELTYLAHREIIEALVRRDRTAYAYLLGQHLEFGMKFVANREPKKASE